MKSRPDKALYSVNKKTGCWDYLWATTAGYGKLRRKKKKNLLAHRYFYEKYKGKVPDNLEVDHLCRNRKCVNPEHLEAVTCAENIRRGRRTKLTLQDVLEIKKLCGRGELLQKEIAKRFNVTRENITAIKNGYSWVNL